MAKPATLIAERLREIRTDLNMIIDDVVKTTGASKPILPFGKSHRFNNTSLSFFAGA